MPRAVAVTEDFDGQVATNGQKRTRARTSTAVQSSRSCFASLDEIDREKCFELNALVADDTWKQGAMEPGAPPRPFDVGCIIVAYCTQRNVVYLMHAPAPNALPKPQPIPRPTPHPPPDLIHCTVRWETKG